MSRQLKRVLKKLQPLKATENKNFTKKTHGKDYLLIIFISLSISFLLIGWTNFTLANRVLYIMLVVSLLTTYVKRHFELSETQIRWLDRIGIATLLIAAALFVVVINQRFF